MKTIEEIESSLYNSAKNQINFELILSLTELQKLIINTYPSISILNELNILSLSNLELTDILTEEELKQLPKRNGIYDCDICMDISEDNMTINLTNFQLIHEY